MFDDLAKRLRGFEATALDRVQCETILGELARLDATTEAARLRVTSRLVELSKATASVFPEHSIAQASRRGRTTRCARPNVRRRSRPWPRWALRLPMDRSPPATSMSSLASFGTLNPGSDPFSPRTRPIWPTSPQTPRSGSSTGTCNARSSLTTDDGCARLERQRRATHLRTWTDCDKRDDLSARRARPRERAALRRRWLDAAVEALFARAVPDTCPSDPVAKNDHLRGLALMAITGDQPTAIGPPRAEISVLVDLQTLTEGLHARSIVDVGADTSVPVETVRRWACDAQLLPVVLGGDGVVLDVGRARRLATANQRRAIRSHVSHLCNSGVRCQPRALPATPHPLVASWRRHRDANLVPLCNRHHHAVHEGGWRLALDMPERQLTVRRPDGTTLTTGPPLARAG